MWRGKTHVARGKIHARVGKMHTNGGKVRANRRTVRTNSAPGGANTGKIHVWRGNIHAGRGKMHTKGVTGEPGEVLLCSAEHSRCNEPLMVFPGLGECSGAAS